MGLPLRAALACLIGVLSACQSSQIMPWDVDGCWDFSLYYDVNAKNRSEWVQIYEKHLDDLREDPADGSSDRRGLRKLQREILVEQMLAYLEDVSRVSLARLSPVDQAVRGLPPVVGKALRDELCLYRDDSELPASGLFRDVFIPGFISNLVGYGVTSIGTSFSVKHAFLLVHMRTGADGFYKDYYWPTWERPSERDVRDPHGASRSARSVSPGPIYGVEMYLGASRDDQGVALWNARTERRFDFVLEQSLGKLRYTEAAKSGSLEEPFNKMPFLLDLTLHWEEDPGFLWGNGDIRNGRGNLRVLGEAHVRRCLPE